MQVDKWSDIPTTHLGKLRHQLLQMGWQISYEYQGMDAGIDYSETHFVQEGVTLQLKWDPWDEGVLSGPANTLAPLKHRINNIGPDR
jgi:hypothetical protein